MIKINEIFYSLQGEGKTIGQPKLFIRLSGCNLKCDFCDTKYHIENNEVNFSLLKKYKRWCITGGEPLLQQEEIEKLIEKYKPKWIEVETNGTIEPNGYLLDVVNLWNISPKNPKFNAVKKIKYNFLDGSFSTQDYILKFVYNNDSMFIKKIVKKYNIMNSDVYIMPEGETKKQQEEKMKMVIDFCLKNNFNFSPRLHVLVYDDERGV